MIVLTSSSASTALLHAPHAHRGLDASHTRRQHALHTRRGLHTRRDALGLGLAAAAASPAAAAASGKYPSSTTLADGLSFPLASFGLQFYDDETAERLTLLAIEAGFRNFFAGCNTLNQRGFARGVKASGVPRDELFICGSVLRSRALDADAA